MTDPAAVLRRTLEQLVEKWRTEAIVSLQKWPRGAILPSKKIRACADELARVLTEQVTPLFSLIPLPVAPREEPVTACCAEPIAADRRFCPRCGYEARVIEGNTSPPDRREDYTPFLGKMRRVLILRAEKAEAEAQRLQALLAAPGDTPPISLDGSPRCADCGRSALDVEVNGHDLDCAAGGTPPPENSNRKENIMESVIIPAKTVVHIKGIPVTLAVDTIVETSYGNMSLLTGYHYAHLGQLELENAANVPPPESSHG